MIAGDILILNKTIRRLKDDIADLSTTKKMEIREIEHLVKIKEEKLNIEHEKKTVELERTFQQKEMDMQTGYHDKFVFFTTLIFAISPPLLNHQVSFLSSQGLCHVHQAVSRQRPSGTPALLLY